MNPTQEIKLPHDDFSVLPFAWTWLEYLLLVSAVLVILLLVYFVFFLWKRWSQKKTKESYTPLQLLRKEAMQLQVSEDQALDYGGLYGDLSRILRRGIDVSCNTSLSAWNFEEISSQPDLLSRHVGSGSHKVLGFLGRADRCIYSGNKVDAVILKQDKKLVVETIDGFCQQELKAAEGKK